MGKEMKRDFDGASATWDNEPRRVQLAGAVVAALCANVPLSKAMVALDYGCGSGLVTMGLRTHVGKITGADNSMGMLEVLGGKVRDQGTDQVDTQLLTLDQEDPLRGNYDLIVSSMTMHHIPDVPQLIATFVKHLSPGGWLALADLEAEDGSFHDDPTGIEHHGFPRGYFTELYRSLGLAEIKVVTAARVEKAGAAGPRIYPVLLWVGKRLP